MMWDPEKVSQRTVEVTQHHGNYVLSLMMPTSKLDPLGSELHRVLPPALQRTHAFLGPDSYETSGLIRVPSQNPHSDQGTSAGKKMYC